VEEEEEEEEGTGGEVAAGDRDAVEVAAVDASDNKCIIGNRGMNRLVHTADLVGNKIYNKIMVWHNSKSGDITIKHYNSGDTRCTKTSSLFACYW
jgi:hypothetical protein